MSRGVWRALCVCSVVGILCGVVGVAEGFILPVRFFLQKYAKQRRNFTRLKISQTTTTWRNGTAQTVEERLFIRAPGQVRLERWRGGKRLQVDVWSGTRHLQWRPGAQPQRNKRKVQHRFDLFAIEYAGSGFANIKRLLRYMRVCTSGTLKRYSRHNDYVLNSCLRLSWFQHTPVVVIGRPKKHQLWLHKSQYYPMRFMAGLGGSKPKYDLRFFDYHYKAGVPVFPGRVMLYRDGKLTSQTLVSQVKVGASVPKSLFTQAN